MPTKADATDAAEVPPPPSPPVPRPQEAPVIQNGDDKHHVDDLADLLASENNEPEETIDFLETAPDDDDDDDNNVKTTSTPPEPATDTAVPNNDSSLGLDVDLDDLLATDRSEDDGPQQV